jgi:hypothetical protein
MNTRSAASRHRGPSFEFLRKEVCAMPRRRLDFVLSSSPRSLPNVLLFTSP